MTSETGSGQGVTTGEDADQAWADRTLASFQQSLQGLQLPTALQKYHAILERKLGRLSAAYFADRQLACFAGCSVCCHQPLVLHLVELAELYFSFASRFSRPDFQAKLQQEIQTLDTWRREGVTSAPQIAARYLREHRPCVLLGPDGTCSVYRARPFMCRNLLSAKVCTFEAQHFIGFAVVGRLDKQMLESLGRHYDLGRFDTRPNKPAAPWFFLGEGLWWLHRHPRRDELRGLLRA